MSQPATVEQPIKELLRTVELIYADQPDTRDKIFTMKAAIKECIETDGLVNLSFDSRGRPSLNLTYRRARPAMITPQ